MAPFAARLAWQGAPLDSDTESLPGSRRIRSRGGTRESIRNGPSMSPAFAYSLNLTPTEALGGSFERRRDPLKRPNSVESSRQEVPELQKGEPEFEEASDLLRELRNIFDWMAQEQGATKIASRKFKQRLPELHKRMPHIASNFRRMDANGDCWLEWSEFVEFCLKDTRLLQQMRRTTAISVYSRERNGDTAFKELLDPQRMCEVGTIPPLLPWEISHVVEWRVENLLIGASTGCPVMHGPLIVRPGTSVASPPFRGAGVCGYLRFWPSGYWTEVQRRLKVSNSAPHITADENVQGPYPPPSPQAWCCVGCCMPAGTHLVYRFFAGDQKSEKRECFWHEGTHPGNLWAPESLERPVLRPGDSMVVGVEIFRNLGATNGYPLKKCKQKRAKDRTPIMRDATEVAQDPLFVHDAASGATHLDSMRLHSKTKSLPSLPSASSWRSFDKLLRQHRREAPQKESENRQQPRPD